MSTGSTPAPGLRVSMILAKREFVRTVRQPSRLVAAIATPARLWIVLARGEKRHAQNVQML